MFEKWVFLPNTDSQSGNLAAYGQFPLSVFFRKSFRHVYTHSNGALIWPQCWFMYVKCLCNRPPMVDFPVASVGRYNVLPMGGGLCQKEFNVLGESFQVYYVDRLLKGGVTILSVGRYIGCQCFERWSEMCFV